MSFIDVTALFVVETAASILETGLAVANMAGLPVSSWRTGDPTRSLYKYLAEVLATLEGANGEYIKAGFLSQASGDWLTVLASEVYGVDRVEAAASTPTVTFANAGGGHYEIEAGDITVKCTATGATFHNTEAGTLTGGGSVTLDFVADVAGSSGSVSANDIDAIVTSPFISGGGVTISASGAAVGVDEQDDASLKQDCQDTLGALSPDGPPDAYEYVARQSKLTGVSTITRSRATHDSATGVVTVYVAGASGATDGASVIAAQAAIDIWATPLTLTATAVNATETTVAVTATITGEDLPADAISRCTAALGTYFSRLPIADVAGGTVFRDAIIGTLRRTLDPGNLDSTLTVSVSAPSGNTAYTVGHVPKLGVVGITEV